ncbi:YbjQ family protein [Cohnella abietis]|uniref:UPF0145 protein KCTCHS21_13270 n=1 Tax=Cohnella abietis TaxID=2507935 RepID=A0A3T1D1J9_9BACL|nr:YbjQ family protein [Cohnella abietis]BBI31928.1 hypothetical protein KCTCHS21_13270 [Cohnella abietis]
MSKKKMIITTTSTIEGTEIQHYKGIVSARVVTGTGYFADLFADFSDVFGGRSNTYQKQLKSIYDEVIELLTDEARKVSANAIIGVRIDHDEISGKGKQMFMVTATGTAVAIDNSTLSNTEEERTIEINHERLEYEINKLQVINNIRNDSSLISQYMPYFIQHNIFEVMNEVVNYYLQTELYEEFSVKVVEYIQELEVYSRPYLYKEILTSMKPIRILNLLARAKMLDYSKVNEYINVSSFEFQKASLKSIMSHQSSYDLSDIDKMEAMKQTLKSVFTNRGKVLDSEKWECECGKTNKASSVYCRSCNKDIRGFSMTDIDPNVVIKFIDERQQILKQILLK